MSTNKDSCLIFEEDEVSRDGESGKEYGLVIESSEFLSSDDDDDDDDEEEDRVKKGTVRVAWYPAGNEEVIDEKELRLEDRSLMPGDVVRRLISGSNSQRGFVKDMDVVCDVRVIGSQYTLTAINAKNLVKTEPWQGESELMTLDCWVGRVEGVVMDIVIRLPDNSKLELQNVDMITNAFNDVSDASKDEDSEFRCKVFYVGQVLEERVRTIFECDHEWIVDSKVYAKPSRNCTKKIRVIVEQVNFRELDVHWMCRGYAESDLPEMKMQMPPRTLDEELVHKARRLDYFDHCSVQIGDRAYFKPPSTGAPTSLKPTLSGQHRNNNDTPSLKTDTGLETGLSDTDRLENGVETTHRSQTDVESCSILENGLELSVNVETGDKRTRCDSCEERGDQEDSGMDLSGGGEILELSVEDQGAEEYDSDPDDRQEDTSRKRTSSGGKHQRNRVVLSVPGHGYRRTSRNTRSKRRHVKPPDVTAVEVVRTRSYVDVMWQDGSVETRVPSDELHPIHHLDELEFFPGDFVVKAHDDSSSGEYGVVCTVDHGARTCMVKWVTPYHVGADDKPTESAPCEMSVYDIKDHPDYKFRPDQVVVRVCGYQTSPGCTAGQIVDIDPGGELIICWSGGTVSRAYPQEVFLVSDESSEYGSSDWDSDEDDSMCSWETEEEETDTDTDEDDAEEGKRKKREGQSEGEVKDDKKIKKDKDFTPVKTSNESLDLGPGDKLELDYHLDRLETALGRPMQPDVIDRIVDCYRNVLTVHKQCQDLDRLLGSSYFDDKELVQIISQVRRELRREKQNKMQTQLLQQAQSFVNARKCVENGKSSPPLEKEETDCAVPKSKSESSLCQQQIVLLKQSEEGVERVHDVEEEINASLEKASSICSASLRALRTQIVKVREQLEAMWQRKIEQMNREGAQEQELEEEGAAAAVPELMSPLSPDQSRAMPVFEERFITTDVAPTHHNFYSREHTPLDTKAFLSAVRKEMKLLRNSLPAGIKVVGFEERMDLYSVLVVGPSNTPYEDGLFLFDVQLPNSYPAVPPSFHYHSYCTDRLNPNLYDDGKVCVSLLGTWGGKGTELWSSSSNMLQVLVSIQGLILNDEPYYNEAGYEKQRGTQMGMENSKVYNEMAILKLVQSMIKMIKHPPAVFKDDVIEHMRSKAPGMISRLELWLSLTKSRGSSQNESEGGSCDMPDFPLIPASRGFCLTLQSHLDEFKRQLQENNLL